MCGISGIISKDLGFQKSLVAMNRLVKHRGPDDEGFIYLNNNKIVRLAGAETNPLSIIQHSLADSKIEKIFS